MYNYKEILDGIVRDEKLTSIEKYSIIAFIVELDRRAAEKPRGITLEEIAILMQTSKRTVSYRIDDLVKAQMIERVETGQLPNGKKLPMKYKIFDVFGNLLGII